jgi:hypothetical protein
MRLPGGAGRFRVPARKIRCQYEAYQLTRGAPTALLVDLMRQNTELIATVKRLTEQVESLTRDEHRKLVG